MDAQTFVNNFGTIVDAPSGVDRLRELIVSLAVRGQLGTGDANDEPATELLDRTTGKWSLADGFHSLPENWVWVPTVDVLDHQLGKMLNTGKMTGSPVRYLRSVNVRESGRVDISDLNEMLLEPDEMGKYSVHVGDIFVIEGGDAGRSSIWRGELHESLAFQNQLHRLRVKGGMPPEYFLLTLKYSKNSGVIASLASGVTIQHFSASKLRTMPMPVPPLAEQERIVAKVDELMQLCDDLEARQQARYHVTTRLRASSLDALTNAETDDDLHSAWSRAHANWEAVTDHPDSTDALRQTILQLAVQGRLVGQLSAEEHPTMALVRCADERNKLISEGRFRTQSSVTDPFEEPFEVPDGWVWTQIDDCFLVSGGIQKSGKRRPAGNSFPYLRVANVQRGRLDLAEIAEFELFNGELERYQLEPGDLLVVEGNGSESEIGRCARWSGEIDECVHQNHLIRCRPLDRDLEAFTLLYLNSPTGTAVMRRLAVTTSGLYNLSVGKIRAISMPLPPCEEQQRIVSRVRELMNLCDSLERALAKESRAGEALTASTTRILVSS